MKQLYKALRPVLMVALVLAFTGLQNPTHAQEGPDSVVRAFLDAWNSGDMDTMYALLSRRSQEEFPQQIFESRYQVVNDTVNIEGIDYTIHDVYTQGSLSAAVNYDITLESPVFGTIEDPGRTMRLIYEDGRGWGVVWSRMDILNLMTDGMQLTSAGRLPQRQEIYDRNGNPIAQQGRVVAVYTTENSMRSLDECAQLMADLTRRPVLAFQQLFARYAPDTIFFLSEFNVDDYVRNAERIRTICGEADTLERDARVYYGNNAMSSIVGYVGQIQSNQLPDFQARGYSAGDLVGQSGIESRYERQLAGQPERVLRITDPSGYVLRQLGSASGSEAVPITLTIDRELQRITAQALADAYNYATPNWGNPSIAQGGAAVVLDVNTGEVLAAVSYPLVDPMLFDPSSYNDLRGELLGQVSADTRQPLFNHVITGVYAPGSVYKLITAAAVLNEGVVTPETVFDCQLRWDGRPYGDTLESRSDWRETDELPPAGPITPAQAIMSSCNPFFWEFGAILYNNQTNNDYMLADYARQMGMGRDYGLRETIGIPDVPGNLDNPVQNVPVAVNNAVGQGDVQITPLQMAVSVAAIANGGTVYKPYVIRQIGGVNGTELVEAYEPEVLNALDFAPGVLETIQAGMCGAVENFDLGTAHAVFYNDFSEAPTYTVCGKTGTAQTGPAGSAARPNAWFASFAPADNPQIAVVVMVSQSLEGSQIAAPITRRILDNYFGSPEAPFPEWWAQGPYVPLRIPQGSTGG